MAQLTVRNVGSMVSLVNANTDCGFASPAVLSSPQVEGTVGSAGVLTFTVNQCVIDLGSNGVVNAPDCNGNGSTARGKFTISATRRIEGTLTGNPQSPIIPSSADAVTITVTNATFENFEARSENSGNFLIMKSGSLSAVVKPRLAASASSGACSISTPNVAFSDIVYTNAQLFLTTPDNAFEVPVPTSNISAQNGVGVSQENSLLGTVTVFESPVSLSHDLDPDYDAARFVSGYSCHPDLPATISYQCADLNTLLAEGAARLSAKMQGTITSLIDANATCGFSSPAVLGAPAVAAPTGGAPTVGEDGVLTLTVTNCELSYPAGTVLTAGCNGSSTVVGGKITVSGTKVVSGRFTGNPASLIVPATEQPATISLTSVIGAEGFKVGSTADVNALEATAGTLVGTTRPRVFVGATTGVCSVSSPHADLTMQWSDADLMITSTTGTLALDAVSTDLQATNGSIGERENALSGTVTVAGTAHTVNASGVGLDPTFDLATFESGWQCGTTLEALTSTPNSNCGVALMGTIGGGSAALTMRTLGTVTSLVDANNTCGFSTPAIATAPSFSASSVGDDDVTATFTLPNPCTITLPPDYVVSTNCLGQTTSVGGTVVVTGTKAVTGFRTGSTNPAEYIVPTSSRPAEFNLTLSFTDFVVKSSASTAFLTVHSGSLAGTVQPRTALAPSTGACGIATPNVTFSNVVWTDGEVTLNSAGSRFNAALSPLVDSSLAAQNGNFGEITNSLSGGLSLDQLPLPLPPGTLLDRAYDQATFDSTYACAPGGPVLVPDAACSFRQVLGGAAARLLAGSVAVATGASTNPAFSCYPPETVTGTPGGPGSSTTAASNCAVALPADTTLSTECTGGVSKGGGSFAISGTKNTTGLAVDTNADATADTVAPLSRTGVTYDNMSYVMNGWSFEKLAGPLSTGKLTLTGTVGVQTFTPVLAQSDADDDGTADSPVFAERTPIFEVAGLSLTGGTAQLLLQGKTFNVGLANVDLDMLVGAFGGRANTIGGSLVVDGEPVAVTAGSPFQTQPPFTQQALDDSYSCNPLIVVPAN